MTFYHKTVTNFLLVTFTKKSKIVEIFTILIGNAKFIISTINEIKNTLQPEYVFSRFQAIYFPKTDAKLSLKSDFKIPLHTVLTYSQKWYNYSRIFCNFAKAEVKLIKKIVDIHLYSVV